MAAALSGRSDVSGWRLDSYLIRAAQLTALWAYGVAQPIFSFVDGNPELLTLRRASQTEVIAFAVCLAFVPPVVVAAYIWAVSRASRWAGDMLFLACLAVFTLPLAFQLVRALSLPAVLLAVAALGGLAAVGVVAYMRWRAVRMFLAFSLVLPIVAFGAFVHASPVAANADVVAKVDVSTPVPVVLVVLDEFPLSSLLTTSGRIDAIRYPNLARLARDGTWYPNATTVADSTIEAVPEILTSRLSNGRLPILRDHPDNLFTLLGGPTYELDVHESVTALCPLALCPADQGSTMSRVETLLTRIGSLYVQYRLGSGADAVATAFHESERSRADDFAEFVHGLSGPGPTRSLHFAHLLLPHQPYEFLPSGHAMLPAPNEGLYRGTWIQDPWPVLQAYQRHLLQVGYTDALIGQLLSRLQRVGLYDRALVVVVADHGARFRAGERHRQVNQTNFGDIASIPLLVKYPRQRNGEVDSRAARTVDVLPTIADILGIRIPWHVDGVSLLAAPVPRRVVVVHQRSGPDIRSTLDVVRRQTRATVARKEAAFGSGRESLFEIGVHRELVGSSVAPGFVSSPNVRVRIEAEGRLAHVRKSSGFVPVRIWGVLEEGEIDSNVELAIAVNGRIAALARCRQYGDERRFGATIPEAALRDGRNRVDVFAIEAHDGKTRLVRLGGTAARPPEQS